MEENKLSREQVNELNDVLKAGFPREAYTKDTSRGFELTSIKAQYVVDRLNCVFGIFGWDYETEVLENTDKGVLFEGKLTVRLGDEVRTVKNFGSSMHKKLIADTYKSASTDALGKCASMIGIGDATFKGLIRSQGGQQAPAQQPPQQNKGGGPTPKMLNFANNLKGKMNMQDKMLLESGNASFEDVSRLISKYNNQGG